VAKDFIRKILTLVAKGFHCMTYAMRISVSAKKNGYSIGGWGGERVPA